MGKRGIQGRFLGEDKPFFFFHLGTVKWAALHYMPAERWGLQKAKLKQKLGSQAVWRTGGNYD